MRMNRNLKLLYIWTQHQNRMFWRSRIGAFFTLALPFFMMLAVSGIFNNVTIDESANLSFEAFFVPALASFSAASATYTNLAINMTIMREERILKRVKGTPLPSSIYILSAIISAIWISLIGICLLLLIGLPLFGVEVLYGRLLGVALFFVVGVVAFSIMGLAVSSFIGSARSAPAFTNATLLPLSFISGVFIYVENAPSWLAVIGRIFPLRGFVEGIRAGFDSSLPAINYVNLLVLLAWGVVGFGFLLKRFQWVPTVEASKQKRTGNIRADNIQVGGQD